MNMLKRNISFIMLSGPHAYAWPKRLVGNTLAKVSGT